MPVAAVIGAKINDLLCKEEQAAEMECLDPAETERFESGKTRGRVMPCEAGRHWGIHEAQQRKLRSIAGLIERLKDRPFGEPADQDCALAMLRDLQAQAKATKRPVVLFMPDGVGGWLIGDPDAPTRLYTGQRMAAWASYEVFKNPDALPPASDFSTAKDAATCLRKGRNTLANELESYSRLLAASLRRIQIHEGLMRFDPDSAPCEIRTSE